MAPVAGEMQRHNSAATMVLLVLALVLWKGWRRSRGRGGCHTCNQPQLDQPLCKDGPDASVDALVGRGGARVQFDSKIACFTVNDLTMLPQEQKAEFWWQQYDFNDFLNVRVQVGNAYQAAAQKLGVDIRQVSSVGSHGSEGYKAMIEAFPKLANESRRGLGLGRSRQRARNRDAYIAAVLAEQECQRQEEGWEEGSDDEDAESRPFELDVEALAAVALRFSQQDRAYAAQLARQHFEQHEEEKYCQVQQPLVSSLMEAAEATPHQRELEAVLNRLAAGPSGSTCQTDSSKGFGLSRDRLQQAGLSPSGHALSLYQRLRRLPPAIDFRNAGGTASENDEDEEEESIGFHGAEAIGKDWYHSIKFARTTSEGGIPQFKVAAPLGIETQAYGTRQEYRNWRTSTLAKLP